MLRQPRNGLPGHAAVVTRRKPVLALVIEREALTPRDSRFGSPLNLSRVHSVCPAAVVEVTYLTWTEDNLLRQLSYKGAAEDKPAVQGVPGVGPGSAGGVRNAAQALVSFTT